MMKSILHLHEPLEYGSVRWFPSALFAGVRYGVRRISLGQRIELTRAVRELLHNEEFLRAGDSGDQLEASLADLLVRKLYLQWGLAGIEGFRIDGEAATPQVLVDAGPEQLSEEIAARIQAELGLSEEERKNS